MGMVACFAAADAATIEGLKADPKRIEAFLYPDDGEGEPENYLDVDKAWHCIHFMLTGDADGGPEPLVWTIFGGEEAGVDFGYGPARLMKPSDARAVASALEGIDEQAFRARFNPSAMKTSNIYLSEMCARDGDEALDYVAENYAGLRDFYLGVASRGDGVVLWVS